MLKLDPSVLVSDDMARIMRNLVEDPILLKNMAYMEQMLRQMGMPEQVVEGFTDYALSLCRYCWSKAEIETVRATIAKLERNEKR